MKVNKMVIGAIIAFLSLSSFCQQIITPEQAKQAIRNFENDSALELPEPTLEVYDSENDWADWKQYRFEKKQDSNWLWWFVNAYTGEVTCAYHGERFNFQLTEPSGNLTQDQCRTIAINYATAKYSGFDIYTYPNYSTFWRNGGWKFLFIEEFSSGSYGSSNIIVCVNADNEQIQYYHASRQPITNPKTPLITLQEAIDAVLLELENPIFVSSKSTHLFENPDSIFWNGELTFKISSEADKQYCSFVVDAITGEVISINHAFGSQASVKSNSANNQTKTLEKKQAISTLQPLTVNGKPQKTVPWLPLLIDGKPFICLRHIANIVNAKLTFDNGIVTWQYKEAVISLEQDSPFYTYNGERLSLLNPARSYKNRLYVPIEILPLLTGIKADYNATTGAIDLRISK